MMRMLIFCAALLLNFAALAQVKPVQQDLSELEARHASLNFEGSFALVAETDSLHNYILVDLTVFSSRFGRVYFMDQSFTCRDLVNIDPDITKSRIFFTSDKSCDLKAVMKRLDQMKEDVLKKASALSMDEQSAWLKSNDKYK